MNWVDVTVVLLAVLVAVLGAKQGLIVSLPASVMLFAGAVVGIKIAPALVSQIQNVASKAAISVAIPVLLAALGETFGVWIGWQIRRRIKMHKLVAVDNLFGAVVQAVMVFVVAWLFVLPLTAVQGLPALASEINGSTVLGAVNSVMPASARELTTELRAQLDIPGLPTVSGPFSRTPISNVGPPNTALQSSPIVREVQSSVLKVRGRADSCSRALEGTGFVIDSHRVLTNAHVVAGTDSVSVESHGEQLTAHVVYYDPNVDIAVLSVPDLPSSTPTLHFEHNTATSGQDSIVLGYPLDGPYTASAAKVREEIPLHGPNIYDTQTVDRDVYTVRATVRSGNSGGPLLDPNTGEVLGVVFGAAVDNDDTGFVLTYKEIANAVNAAPGLHQSVSTQQCAA